MPVQTEAAERAVTGSDLSPTISDMAARGQLADVSVTVNFTVRGAGPEDGTASSRAFAVSGATVTVTVWRTSSVAALVRVA